MVLIRQSKMTKHLVSKFEEVQLIYRNRTKASDRPSVKNAHDAYHILHDSWNMEEINLLEECKVLLLDNQLKLMSVASVSKGGLSGTVVDPRIVFAIALKRRANRIILAHNHPSGVLKPSHADIKLTQEFIKAGSFLQIPLEDHIIITQENYCSLMGDYYQELSNDM